MILDYNKYIEYIKEGLIRTYNIQKHEGTLDIELNSIGVKFNINILSKFLYELEILNSQELSQDKLNYIITISQNLGYFPSYIWLENNLGKNGFPFGEKYLSNRYKTIKIRFESKYEDSAYTNDLEIPEVAYHLTPSKNRDKILKNGLCPKSGFRKSFHTDRIYMFYNLDDYKESLKLSDKNDIEYDLFQVELKKDNIIHTDPNYFSKGFYTYDNISPKNLILIKNNIK